MIITEVRTRIKHLPYKDMTWKISSGAIKEAQIVFVDIVTDNGLIGNGCGFGGALFISGESEVSIANVIESVFTKLLIGRNPFDIVNIMEDLDKAVFMNYRAKAAIDLSLYDLMGKALGIPVHGLIGNSAKPRIPVMRFVGLKEPKAMANDAIDLVEQGYKALKLKLGADKESDIACAKAVCEVASDNVTLAVDMNGAYKPKDAVEVIKGLEQYRVALIEQPVKREDIEGLAFVRERVQVPIEVDESIITLSDAVKVIKMGAADFISIKLLKMGGIYKAQKIASLCEAFKIGCVVGSTPGSQMVDIASSHFFVSTANVWWAAEVGEFTRMQEDPVSGAVIKDGFLEIPDGPGFGLTMEHE
jgi:L-alanine-DL-glutamate epimerase-like enolase superfamily enzyme